VKRADAEASLPRINFRLPAAQTGMVLVISLPESA
jgi:hypothetical protein